MIDSIIRKAAKPHRCYECSALIPTGSLYLVSSMSPDHDGLGYDRWIRSSTCEPCARTLGWGPKFIDARAT